MSPMCQTLPPPGAACPSCHHEGPFRRHAVRASWWRDVPTSGRPQVRRGHIVRWRCPACLQTHSCQPDWALPGKRLTRELEGWIRQALQHGQTVRAVARLCGVDEKTVRAWAQLSAMQESAQSDPDGLDGSPRKRQNTVVTYSISPCLLLPH